MKNNVKTDAKAKTTLELNNGDCAIVFRVEGQCELALPNHGGNADDDVSPLELLAAGLTMFLRDPKFVEMIKGEFIKKLHDGEKVLDERTDGVELSTPEKIAKLSKDK